MINTYVIHSFFEQYTIAVPFAALLFAIIMKGCIHALKGRFTVGKML